MSKEKLFKDIPVNSRFRLVEGAMDYLKTSTDKAAPILGDVTGGSHKIWSHENVIVLSST